MRLLLLTGALSVVFACSSSHEEDGHDHDFDEGEDPLAEIEGIAFKDLTHEQRGVFMRFKVLPRMSEVLAGIDPVRFAQVGCKTCHGQNAAANHFEMPGDIKAVNFNMLPEGPIVDAMAQIVVPEMAAILGLEPFDPGTGEGEFGCGNCHRIVE